MSKMNKIITNNSVQLSESEVNNLIVTLGPVIEAFTGGGGGQGSVIYTPGDDNISINNTQHTIALSTDAATKLNTPIPTKVSDLTDSANYATTDAINTKLDKDEFAAVSGDFATEQYVQAASAEVTGWVNNQNYLTQVPDTYYLKTETSGKDEISNAFSNIPAYILTGDSNITATSAQDGKDIKWNLAINAHPTVTDTTLTGERGIYTHTTNVSGQWCVELVQSAYDAINDVSNKLDSSDFTTYTGTTAPATYQPKGDYATVQYVQGASADVTAWVNNQNYLKTVPSEYITETELSTALINYVTSSITAITGTDQFALTTTGWAKVQAGSTFTGVTTTGSISGGGVNNDTIGLLTSAENALATIGNKVDKPDTTQESLNNKYLVYSTLTGTGEVTGWTDFNANVYSKSESDGRYQKKEDMSSYLTTAQYQTDSAKYVLTGDILTAANNKLTGIKIGSTSYTVPTTDLSNYYTKSETSATGELNTEFAKKLDKTTYATDSATFVTSSNSTITGTQQYALTTAGWASVETAYLPLTGGTVTGQLVVSGGSTFDQQFLKITREGVNGFARLGLGQYGALALKTDDSNNHTTQVNISPNASNNELIQVQYNGGTVGYLIPAVTANTTAGLTNDGILHIILES